MTQHRIPILTHVKDYVAILEARGCVPGHVDGITKRLTWFLEESKVTRLSQLRPSVAEAALKVLRDAHRSDRTVAHYAAALKSFTRWLWKDKRTREDLLADLDRPKIQSESKRSALSPRASRQADRCYPRWQGPARDVGRGPSMVVHAGDGHRAASWRTTGAPGPRTST